MTIPSRLKYLLLQVRDPDDPMSDHEIRCFARALGCDESRLGLFDLLTGFPSENELDSVDVLLFGGSGDYSAAGEGEWLDRTLDGFREIVSRKRPTFASCWGFQAMARAAGGKVIHDLSNAELGTIDLKLTPSGLADPVFGPLGERFLAQAGHEDHVIELPLNAQLLASSDRVPNQAYRFVDAPIYCTQFHPELLREDLLIRLRSYPRYIEQISGLPHEVFAVCCQETVETQAILPRFVKHVFG